VTKAPLIAVIDDNDSFRMALAESLCSLGYDTRAFASADEFVVKGGKGSFDCVVTDIHMPGMSGLDLKDLLVTRGLNVPVIMITARAESDLEIKAAATGAFCLLRKPFETDALIDCLKRALET
jgi:FixJ family two-component response regulator